MKLQLLIKSKMLKKIFLAFKLSDVVFIMLINVNMAKFVGILSLNEHDKFHALLI